jgi:hypothetical protein
MSEAALLKAARLIGQMRKAAATHGTSILFLVLSASSNTIRWLS